jgi:CspA family cold shock protein
MNTGVIKFFIESKGYGFITDDESGQDYFVHVSGLNDEVEPGDKVEFELVEGDRGFKAQEVKKVAE